MRGELELRGRAGRGTHVQFPAHEDAGGVVGAVLDQRHLGVGPGPAPHPRLEVRVQGDGIHGLHDEDRPADVRVHGLEGAELGGADLGGPVHGEPEGVQLGGERRVGGRQGRHDVHGLGRAGDESGLGSPLLLGQADEGGGPLGVLRHQGPLVLRVGHQRLLEGGELVVGRGVDPGRADKVLPDPVVLIDEALPGRAIPANVELPVEAHGPVDGAPVGNRRVPGRGLERGPVRRVQGRQGEDGEVVHRVVGPLVQPDFREPQTVARARVGQAAPEAVRPSGGPHLVRPAGLAVGGVGRHAGPRAGGCIRIGPGADRARARPGLVAVHPGPGDGPRHAEVDDEADIGGVEVRPVVVRRPTDEVGEVGRPVGHAHVGEHGGGQRRQDVPAPGRGQLHDPGPGRDATSHGPGEVQRDGEVRAAR